VTARLMSASSTLRRRGAGLARRPACGRAWSGGRRCRRGRGRGGRAVAVGRAGFAHDLE
jgi:hypothetical protein